MSLRIDTNTLDLVEITALMAKQAQEDRHDARARAHDAQRAQISHLQQAADKIREGGTLGVVTGMLGAGLQLASGVVQLGSSAVAASATASAHQSAGSVEKNLLVQGLGGRAAQAGAALREAGTVGAAAISGQGGAVGTVLTSFSQAAQATGAKLQSDARADESDLQAHARSAQARAEDSRGLEKDATDRRRDVLRQLSSRTDAEHDLRSQVLRG